MAGRCSRARSLAAAAALAACLCVGLAAGPASGGEAADQDFFGADFEAFAGIPAEAATPLSREELGDLRGGSLGFYFQVVLSGSVESDGTVAGRLDVTASLDGDSGRLAFRSDGDGDGGGHSGNAQRSVVFTDTTTGQPFRVEALIGDAFTGAQGIFQISQVPGSGNNIGQAMNINLVIIQAGQNDVAAIRTQLSPLFGF